MNIIFLGCLEIYLVVFCYFKIVWLFFNFVKIWYFEVIGLNLIVVLLVLRGIVYFLILL